MQPDFVRHKWLVGLLRCCCGGDEHFPVTGAYREIFVILRGNCVFQCGGNFGRAPRFVELGLSTDVE